MYPLPAGFPSREVIIAEMWLGIAGSFQRGFLAILETGDYVEALLYTVYAAVGAEQHARSPRSASVQARGTYNGEMARGRRARAL